LPHIIRLLLPITSHRCQRSIVVLEPRLHTNLAQGSTGQPAVVGLTGAREQVLAVKHRSTATGRAGLLDRLGTTVTPLYCVSQQQHREAREIRHVGANKFPEGTRVTSRESGLGLGRIPAPLGALSLSLSLS